MGIPWLFNHSVILQKTFKLFPLHPSPPLLYSFPDGHLYITVSFLCSQYAGSALNLGDLCKDIKQKDLLCLLAHAIYHNGWVLVEFNWYPLCRPSYNYSSFSHWNDLHGNKFTRNEWGGEIRKKTVRQHRWPGMKRSWFREMWLKKKCWWNLIRLSDALTWILLYFFSSACKDKNKRCKFWASTGQCRKNPKYMLPNCSKSCGKC